MTAEIPDGDRFAAIEVLLSHLQHDIDKLNEALISQQEEIGEVKRSLSRLKSAVDEIPAADENRLDERPPHY